MEEVKTKNAEFELISHLIDSVDSTIFFLCSTNGKVKSSQSIMHASDVLKWLGW